MLAVATFLSLVVGGGIFLVVGGDSIPGLNSEYSPAFRTLDKSTFGPTEVLVQRKNYVFRNEADYFAFWELIHGNDPAAKRPPLISFAREQVIAVVGGVRNEEGFDIYIKDIVDSTEERLIEVGVISSSGECQTGALKNPYHMVVVKKTDKPLRAIEIKEEYSCN